MNFGKQSCRSLQHFHRKGRLLLLALCWIGLPTAALAQGRPTDLDHFERVIAPQIKALHAAQPPFGSPEAKINTQLLNAARATRPNVAATAQRHPNEQVEVDIVAQVTPDVIAEIAKLGGTVINQFPADRAVRAKLPLSALTSLAANSHVKSILPAMHPKLHQEPPAPSGQVPVEGDIAHKADLARSTYKKADGSKVDGSGVKVCVLSISMNAPGPPGDTRSAIEIALAAHAIPPGVGMAVLAGQWGPQPPQGTGEGLAMLEIVHQLAPGSTLAFATVAPNPPQMAQNIRDLANILKCKIMVDDATSFYDQPFQDGAVAQAINEVTAAGVLYVSAAGNYGNKKHGKSGTWEGQFKDGGSDPRFTGLVVHQFGSALHATVTSAYDPKNPRTEVALYWNDEWFNGQNDYGIYIFDANDVLLGAASSAGVPLAFVDLKNSPNTLKRHYLDQGDKIYVIKTTVSQSVYLRLATFGATLDQGTGSAIWGHASTRNALTVGAVTVPTPAAAFTSGATVSPGSSDGPVRMFFKADGTPFDQTINKPDLAAAHCVTTTFPLSTRSPSDTLNPFCGTSAAAPHVAAIAALILSYKPTLTLAQVKLALLASAITIDPPGQPWNATAGYGIPMADKALAIATGMNQPNADAAIWKQFGGKLTAYASDGFHSVLIDNNKHVRTIFRKPPELKIQSGATPDQLSTKGQQSIFNDPIAAGTVGTDAYVLNRDGSLVKWNSVHTWIEFESERRNCHPDC